MYVSVALLLVVVVFEGEFYKGTALPVTLNVTNTLGEFYKGTVVPVTLNVIDTLESSGMAGAGTPLGTKKFVPALFFKTNWFRAFQYCRFHGMHLASIESEDEEKQLMSALEKIGLDDVEHIAFWTSGNDLALEGDFVWMSSGRVMTYKNWDVTNNEPNGGTNENCVVLVKKQKQFYWKDIHCSTANHFFACEYYENSVDNLTPTGRKFLTDYV